ncbi:MAG: hypothetical protein AAF431_07515 [Pseudomonadota bacterium]
MITTHTKHEHNKAGKAMDVASLRPFPRRYVYVRGAFQVVLISLLSVGGAMAYNLHIERDGFWNESTPIKISLEEWLGVCRSDPSMKELGSGIEGVNPKTGEKIKVTAEGTCVWTPDESREEYYFYYNSGRITFGTEDNQFRKAKEIAISLSASIYGDEGEEY